MTAAAEHAAHIEDAEHAEHAEYAEHAEHAAHAEHVDVAIVGAGFAGLGMGIRLARQAQHSFVILERATDVGGTWRDNTYPGVASDIPAHLYSFSFRQQPTWSHVFAPGPEIQQYLQASVRDENLGPHLRFGAEMLESRWDETRHRWQITMATGTVTARILIMAVGRLSEPKLPTIDGLDDFEGTVLHTSAWPDDLDLTGLAVGVVGTGASAVQLVPAIAAAARQVVVFQRSAPYVVPRDDRPYSPAELKIFAADPAALERSRTTHFDALERGFAARDGSPADLERLRLIARTQLEAQVADPTLRQHLTPDYEIGCKRVLLSNDYYPALEQPHVTLEPSALASVSGAHRVEAASGASYDLDVLIAATGFHSTAPPFARRVIGRDGERLSAHWSAGMTSYASTVVHGHPNLFIIDGPNASLGHNSAVHMIETQIEYVLGAVAYLRDHPDDELEVSASAEAAYTREIDERAAGTVWLTGGCSSWYLDERSNRLTMLWPGLASTFRERNGVFDPAPYRCASTIDA